MQKHSCDIARTNLWHGTEFVKTCYLLVPILQFPHLGRRELPYEEDYITDHSSQNSKNYYFILAVASSILFSGCGPKHVNVQNNQGNANYSYATTNSSELSGMKFGILNLTLESGMNQTQRAMAMYNPVQMRSLSGGFDSAKQMELSTAYKRDLESIITSKGGTVLGPYNSYTEIPFGEKSKMTLMIEPKIEINLATKQTSTDESTIGHARTEQGVFVAKATGTFRFKEPLTNEVIYVKRINIVQESAPYTYAYKANQSSGSLLVDLAGMAATADFKSNDNRELRRNEVLNSMYSKLMSMVDMSISGGEIAQHQSEIARLKALKRF